MEWVMFDGVVSWLDYWMNYFGPGVSRLAGAIMVVYLARGVLRWLGGLGGGAETRVKNERRSHMRPHS